MQDYQNQWGIMNVLSKKRYQVILLVPQRGISSEAYLGATGSGNVPGMQMFNSYWSLPAGSAINFDRLTGVNVGGQIGNSFAGTVDEIRGVNVGIGSPSGLVDDKYGLYVQNITNGNNSNYAIYTNNGDVRLGDLTNTETLAGTDNLVVADTDGVLKAVHKFTSLGGEWEDDGAGGIRAVQANAVEIPLLFR